MRTTLVLDDDLARAARQRALDLGLTLSELVNRALRDLLTREEGQAEAPFSMPVYGGAPAVDHRPSDLWVQAEQDDLLSMGRR